MSAEADIQRFRLKVRTRYEKAIAKIGFQLLDSIIVRSPVDVGTFRNNWHIGINEIPSAVRADPDRGGAAARAEGLQKLAEITPQPGFFTIVNNLPYGPALESGWSKQAPAGMVAVTVAQFRSIVSGVVHEVRLS